MLSGVICMATRSASSDGPVIDGAGVLLTVHAVAVNRTAASESRVVMLMCCCSETESLLRVAKVAEIHREQTAHDGLVARLIVSVERDFRYRVDEDTRATADEILQRRFGLGRVTHDVEEAFRGRLTPAP